MSNNTQNKFAFKCADGPKCGGVDTCNHCGGVRPNNTQKGTGIDWVEEVRNSPNGTLPCTGVEICEWAAQIALSDSPPSRLTGEDLYDEVFDMSLSFHELEKMKHFGQRYVRFSDMRDLLLTQPKAGMKEEKVLMRFYNWAMDSDTDWNFPSEEMINSYLVELKEDENNQRAPLENKKQV